MNECPDSAVRAASGCLLDAAGGAGRVVVSAGDEPVGASVGPVFLTSRFARKDTTFTTGGLFSLGILVLICFLVRSWLKEGRS